MNMKISEICDVEGRQLTDCLVKISDEQVNALMKEISGAKKIYVYGAGRSMLMLRCFAMRLMHLGFTSYVVGDTTTPAFEKTDLLIVASGSGTTSGVVNAAKKAKSLGGKVAVLTINRNSTLGELADVLVEIPGYTDKVEMKGERPLISSGGSLFEQSVLLLGDAMVFPLAEMMNTPTDHLFSLHANLE